MSAFSYGGWIPTLVPSTFMLTPSFICIYPCYALIDDQLPTILSTFRFYVSILLRKYKLMKITNAMNSSVSINPLIEPPSLTMFSISSAKNFIAIFFYSCMVLYVLETWPANKIEIYGVMLSSSFNNSICRILL